MVSLGIILAGAEVFTNGIEWLGKRLNLAEGAVGSILAAVGTALPETMIPIIAIFLGAEGAGEEIGIGAILGAPFMLATLAMFITGVAVIANRKKREQFPRLSLDTSVMSRDLGFFLIVYTMAMLAAFIEVRWWKMVVVGLLVLAYAVYVVQTLKVEKKVEEEHLSPLLLARGNTSPDLGLILLQVAAALGAIVLGAHIFVDSVDNIARLVGVPRFVLALIIAPVATELPEKFNSIIWISKGKDTLALGNITGAMVFQSSLIPALGITFTEWHLTTGALLSALLALGSAAAVFFQIVIKKYLTPYILMVGGMFYVAFVVLVVTGIIQ
ncbi:membrane protein [Clostridiales bacterium PH28_bin88]|nr:membrane protein [Clostridiales bacterium PH28_bin88]